LIVLQNFRSRAAYEGRSNTAAGLQGRFKIKNHESQAALPVELEPVIGINGKPLLLIRGRFQINLKDFAIEGAEGPAPANDTLNIDLNLTFKADFRSTRQL
jgi:hypothetical protein